MSTVERAGGFDVLAFVAPAKDLGVTTYFRPPPRMLTRRGFEIPTDALYTPEPLTAEEEKHVHEQLGAILEQVALLRRPVGPASLAMMRCARCLYPTAQRRCALTLLHTPWLRATGLALSTLAHAGRGLLIVLLGGG